MMNADHQTRFTANRLGAVTGTLPFIVRATQKFSDTHYEASNVRHKILATKLVQFELAGFSG